MYKQVIVIRRDINMGTGKKIAQGAHASLEAYLRTKEEFPRIAAEWRRIGAKKVVIKGTIEEIMKIYEQIKGKIPCALIRDAGHTQVEPGTITALGIGPWKEEEIDKYTGHMKLL